MILTDAGGLFQRRLPALRLVERDWRRTELVDAAELPRRYRVFRIVEIVRVQVCEFQDRCDLTWARSFDQARVVLGFGDFALLIPNEPAGGGLPVCCSVRSDAAVPPALRTYLVAALVPGAADSKPAISNPALEAWMDSWCLTLADLDRKSLAVTERQLGLGLTGRPLGPATAGRYRKVARSCIRRAVDLEIIERDPWPPASRGAQ